MSSKKVTNLEFEGILEGIYKMAGDFNEIYKPKKFMQALKDNPTDKYRRLTSGKLTPAQQIFIFYYATRSSNTKRELADVFTNKLFVQKYDFFKLRQELGYREHMLAFYKDLWNCGGSWSALLELISTYSLTWIKNNYLYKRGKTYNIGAINSLESGMLVKLFSRYSENKEGFLSYYPIQPANIQAANDFISITNETIKDTKASVVMLVDNNCNKDIDTFSVNNLLYKEWYTAASIPDYDTAAAAVATDATDVSIFDALNIVTSKNFVPYNMLSVIIMLINLDRSQKQDK